MRRACGRRWTTAFRKRRRKKTACAGAELWRKPQRSARSTRSLYSSGLRSNSCKSALRPYWGARKRLRRSRRKVWVRSNLNLRPLEFRATEALNRHRLVQQATAQKNAGLAASSLPSSIPYRQVHTRARDCPLFRSWPMNTAETRASALTAAKMRKLQNALTAMLCGAIPATVLGTLFHTSLIHWLAGFVVGLVWANAFEYFYHRYLLHLPHNYLGKLHQLHHASIGTPQELEHLNLGGTPPLVLAAFVLNGMGITFLAEVLLKLRIIPGIFIAFTVYVIAIEEVHWRIHVGGWLPSWLHFGREHHLIHHDRPDGRYNVFLPLFDWLLGTSKN